MNGKATITAGERLALVQLTRSALEHNREMMKLADNAGKILGDRSAHGHGWDLIWTAGFAKEYGVDNAVDEAIASAGLTTEPYPPFDWRTPL